MFINTICAGSRLFLVCMSQTLSRKVQTHLRNTSVLITISHMRSIYAKYSREFENHVFALIGDFAGSLGAPLFPGQKHNTDWENTFREIWGGWPSWFRLVFRTTKRRHLGCVMIEYVSNHKVRMRKRLRTDMWKPVQRAYDTNNLRMFRMAFMAHRTPQERVEFETFIKKLRLVEDYVCNFNHNEDSFCI